ncbi:MAG: zinc ribbon domain-containing protein [Pseudanabaenaceae cyanobacterium]
MAHPAFCPKWQQAGKPIFSVPAVNLSSGLPRRAKGSEPEVVQRPPREPESPPIQQQNCGRPWMLG